MTPRALAEQDRPPVGVFTDPSISADVINRVRRTSRDWLVDVLGFLLCVGFVTITLVDGIERDLPPGPTAVDVALGGLASLGFWLRRCWPVGFAVTVGLLSLYSVSASGVALLALFFVAVHRRPAVAGLTAAGCALASVLSVLVRPGVAPPNWPQAVLGVACVAAVLAWGMLVRARRQLARSRREQAAFEQELRVAEARRLERTRIAREMHDVLAHRLSLLSLQAGALELWPDAPDEFAKPLG